MFLAPSFAGWPSFSELMRQALSQYPDNNEMRKSIMRIPGLHIMMPNYHVFKHRTIIYNLYEDFDQHNASYAFEFLKSQGKVDDESENIFKSHVEKFLEVPIPEPPVPSLIVYNDGITQTVTYTINRHQDKKVTSLYGSPGDGTVTSEGAEYACKNWNFVECKNLHDSTNHAGLLSNSVAVKAVIDFIQSSEETKKEQKQALFFVSSFQGSPLYATITDPMKVPFCPPNLKEYLIYTSFIENLYKFVDDVDSSYWLTDDCISYLTRIDLNEEKNEIFQQGVLLKSSRFGTGDGAISSEGAEYACKNWGNSICFNHNQSDVTHENMQQQTATVSLETEFINQIQKLKEFPKNKTFTALPVSCKYLNDSYTSSHLIKYKKFTYELNGRSKPNYSDSLMIYRHLIGFQTQKTVTLLRTQ